MKILAHIFLISSRCESFSRSLRSQAVLCGVCGETRQISISDYSLPLCMHAHYMQKTRAGFQYICGRFCAAKWPESWNSKTRKESQAVSRQVERSEMNERIFKFFFFFLFFNCFRVKNWVVQAAAQELSESVHVGQVLSFQPVNNSNSRWHQHFQLAHGLAMSFVFRVWDAVEYSKIFFSFLILEAAREWKVYKVLIYFPLFTWHLFHSHIFAR